MKKISTLFLVCLLSSLLGCTAPLPKKENISQEVASFTLPKLPDPGRAIIYVVRPSSLGTAVRFNVFLDNMDPASEMGYNRGGQFIYFMVNPGERRIFSVAENTPELKIDVKEGDIIFLQQRVYPGFIMARNDLLLLGEAEGKYRVKTLELGTIIKTQK
jgi:hypothetical protein